MQTQQCTEERFLKDVAKHVMTIELDQECHRSIRFGVPGSSCMYFRLNTWPGHLAFSGDMGTFVFNRLEDMFRFFRQKPREDEKVPINEGYWMEKCEAEDTRGQGLREFDPDLLKQYVKEAHHEHYENLRSPEARECWDEIKDQILGCDPNLVRVHDALNDFEHEGFTFQDAWEWHLTRPTFRMLWCLYAISWGIQQYDAANVPAQVFQEAGVKS